MWIKKPSNAEHNVADKLMVNIDTFFEIGLSGDTVRMFLPSGDCTQWIFNTSEEASQEYSNIERRLEPKV